jgi:hypothetical protein
MIKRKFFNFLLFNYKIRLKWNPNDYDNITQITLNSEKIWLPDIVSKNIKFFIHPKKNWFWVCIYVSKPEPTYTFKVGLKQKPILKPIFLLNSNKWFYYRYYKMELVKMNT